MQKDLGLVTAYGAALEGGYTGTFEDYKAKMLELLDFQIQESYDDTEIRNLLAGKADKTEIPEAYDDSQIRDLINGKMDKVNLAAVATSGSYNDLSSKPTIPTNTDSKVTQTDTRANSNYRILFSNTASDSTLTEGARKSSKLLFNPSTGTLTVNKIIGETSGTNFLYLGTLGQIGSTLEYPSTAKELLLLFGTSYGKYGSEYYSSGIAEIKHVPLSIKTDTALGNTGAASSFNIKGIDDFDPVISRKWNSTYGRYDFELLSTNRFSGGANQCKIDMNTRVITYAEHYAYVLNKDFTGFNPTYYNPGDNAPCIFVYYK